MSKSTLCTPSTGASTFERRLRQRGVLGKVYQYETQLSYYEPNVPLPADKVIVERQHYYVFDTQTSGAPASGEVFINHKNPGNGNLLLISTTDADGNDLSSNLPWAATTTGVLYIEATDGVYAFLVQAATVVNNGGYWTVPYDYGTYLGKKYKDDTDTLVSWMRV